MKRLNFALFILAFIACIVTAKAQRITVSIAGNGVSGSSGDGLPAAQARIPSPQYVTADPAGNVFLVDGSKVRMIALNGIITTVAGGGTSTAEGIAATNASISPTYICTNSSGDLFIVTNNKIRKVGAGSHSITTYAGTGATGYSGDGGAATAAIFRTIYGICTDVHDNLYIVDNGNNRIRIVTSSTGVITTIAGNGSTGYTGDGGPATNATITYPRYICRNSSGDIYFSDQSNQYVRKITVSSGTITTYAGGGSSFVDCPRSVVSLSGLSGMCFSASDHFCFDESSCSARQIDPSTDSVTYLGGNRAGGYVDDTISLRALMNNNSGMVSDADDNVYVADGASYHIRKLIKLKHTPEFAFGNSQSINPCPGYSFPLTNLHYS